MKNTTIALAVLLFCFATSICSAKNTILRSGALFGVTGDLVACMVTNNGSTDVPVTITIYNSAGAVLTSSPETFPANTIGTIAGTAADDYYWCQFEVQGKAKSIRAILNASTGNRIYASSPAN